MQLPSAPVSVHIDDFGPARAKVFTLLRSEFGIGPIQAKQILDSPGAELIQAEYCEVMRLVEQLRALGAKVRFAASRVIGVREAVDESYGWHPFGVYACVEGMLTDSGFVTYLANEGDPYPAVYVSRSDISEPAYEGGISARAGSCVLVYERAQVEGVLRRCTGLELFPAILSPVDTITLFPADGEPIRLDFSGADETLDV